MRDATTPLWQELTSSGSESVALTPGASQQTGTFNIKGLEAVTNGMRNYTTGFWLHVTTVVDPDAAGSAVNHDKLAKVLASARLFSPWFGEVFPHRNTRGTVLYHIIQVLALGYQYPQGARTVIPASTDSDVTIDLYYFLPLSFGFLEDPMETSQWVGLFDEGILEGTFDVSTALDGDYAGAVTKATTALRAVCEYIPSPHHYLGFPVQFRDREIAGGGSQPILVGVGQESQLQGVKAGCGLFWLSWLTNAAGIGMGGPDGVDNITQIELPWRNQKLLRNLDPYFLALRRAVGKRVGPSTNGTTAMHDTAGWPFTIADAPVNRPAASAESMFLAAVYPGWNAHTSKFQRVQGNLKINLTVTTTISASHRVVTGEAMEWTEDQRDRLFTAMGLGPGAFRYVKRGLDGGPAPSANQARYSRWYAEPA